MDMIGIQKEFNWVIKVLESCVNFTQLNSAIRLFENFLNKWERDLSNDMVFKLINTFNKLTLAHKTKIKKKLLQEFNYN
jgi:hypothetical protein